MKEEWTVGQLKRILERLPDDATIYGETDIYGDRDILIEHNSWTEIKRVSNLYSDLEEQKFLKITPEAREAMLQAAKAGREAAQAPYSCPHCESEEITELECFDPEPDTQHRIYECDDCKGKWLEVWTRKEFSSWRFNHWSYH